MLNLEGICFGIRLNRLEGSSNKAFIIEKIDYKILLKNFAVNKRATNKTSTTMLIGSSCTLKQNALIL
jgi:hypothetical protein